MLNSFLQEFKEKFNSPISNLFYGMMETKSQCQLCSIIKYNFQVYSFLEFPLQQVNQFCYNTNRRSLLNNDGTNPDVGLYECFEYYQKIDLIMEIIKCIVIYAINYVILYIQLPFILLQ